MLREEVRMEEPARKRFCPDYLAAEFSGSSCNADVDVNDEENDKESVYSWQSYETGILIFFIFINLKIICYIFLKLGQLILVMIGVSQRLMKIL